MFLRFILKHANSIFNKLIKEPSYFIIHTNIISTITNPNNLAAFMFTSTAILKLDILAIVNYFKVFQSVKRWKYPSLFTLYKSVNESVIELDGEWIT